MLAARAIVVDSGYIGKANLQFQERKISIAVKSLLLALLRNIILKDCCGLWVVAIQTAQDGVHVRRPGLAFVECERHIDYIRDVGG